MRVGRVHERMGATDPVRNRLLALYRRFVGEPERESDVYLGFALFFGGIAFGVFGLALFLWSATLEVNSDVYWQVREIAIALAMLGLPSFVLSFVVLLPVDRRARYASGVGVAICLVAVIVFVSVYPENWNVPGGPDYTIQGIAIYAAGLAVLVASSGAGLVEQRLETAQAARAPAEDSGEEETVTDEEVQRDIEEALDEADLTWGGVERDETRRITVDTGEADIDRSGFDGKSANEHRKRDSTVDDAVAGLRNLQGGQQKQGTSDAVDDQATALRELRERQQAEQQSDPSLLERLKQRLGL
jgi:hypothetical protein